jgi:hypothetical protein
MKSLKGREQYVELRTKLYQFRDEASMQALKQFLELMILEGDLRRRSCVPASLPAFQGETVAYETVLKWITEPMRNPQGEQQ